MMCLLTLSAPQLRSSSRRRQSQSHKVWPIPIIYLLCELILYDQILENFVCRDLLGKVISGKIGPNPNSKRAEATHRARDRNYTSLRPFGEATTYSSEKAEAEAATATMSFCMLLLIVSFTEHPFPFLGQIKIFIYSSKLQALEYTNILIKI